MYRGIAPTILGILPYSGVAFTINEQAKRRLARIRGREPTTVERLQCGALSGLFAQTLAYPLEVTRRRMQTIGIVPTSGSESAAVNFSGVSPLRQSADKLRAQGEMARQPQAQPHPAKTASKSAEARKSSMVEGSINKTGQRIIINSGNDAAMRQPLRQHHKPPSMTTTMTHLLEEQGLHGFYKGVSMNWVKGPVAFSISFTAFDALQKWLSSDGERERETKGKSGRIMIQRRLSNNEDGD